MRRETTSKKNMKMEINGRAVQERDAKKPKGQNGMMEVVVSDAPLK